MFGVAVHKPVEPWHGCEGRARGVYLVSARTGVEVDVVQPKKVHTKWALIREVGISQQVIGTAELGAV